MTRSTSALASVALLCGLCFLPPACAESLDARCAEGACDPRDGSPTIDVADGGGDAPIDPCVNNPTDPNCLDESKSLFVSGTKGTDQGATGAMAKPFKTIGAALAQLTAEKRRIYVCTATYPEDLRLTSVHAGLSLLGGLNCDWLPSAEKPRIGKSANPVRIDTAGSVSLAGLSIEAQDAQSGSSVAAFVNASTVTFKGMQLVAGAGGPGESGTLSTIALPDLALLKGQETSDGTGAGAKSFTCPGGATTVGGAGGNAGSQGDNGTPGGVANKGQVATCGTGGTGVDGAAGKMGDAAPGGATLGAITSTAWAPQSGKAGGLGGPGQGGGGGYGSGGGGGGGGAGGCGGAGGGGGRGGGGSMAVAVFSGTLTVLESVIRAKRGGDGGPGVAGQMGQPTGGQKGNGAGCPGGVGGGGGNGGGGAGGAGGVSVGVLYVGPKPTLDAITLSSMVVGNGGGRGGGAAANDGLDGTAAKLLEMK